MIMLTKYCSLCQQDLSVDNFNSKRKECRDCSRWVRSLERYGTTKDQYLKQLEAQGGVCAICESPPEEVGFLRQDHDHKCCPGTKSCGGCLRGLICDADNVSIGRMGDNPDRLRRAADYIESFIEERIDSH